MSRSRFRGKKQLLTCLDGSSDIPCYMEFRHLCHQTSYKRCTKSQNLTVSRLIVQLFYQIHWSQVLSLEDVVGTAPTGNSPTTSEWSIILVPAKPCLILEVWWYVTRLRNEAKEYYPVSQLPCCLADFTNVWNQYICPLWACSGTIVWCI